MNSAIPLSSCYVLSHCQTNNMSFLSRLVGGGGSAASAATTATRSVAKDRLSVILASQRGSELLEGVNMEDLQRDVMKVVEVSRSPRCHINDNLMNFGPSKQLTKSSCSSTFPYCSAILVLRRIGLLNLQSTRMVTSNYLKCQSN